MCKVKAQELKAAAMIAKCADRPALQGVHVEMQGDDYSVTSTDSYMLFSAHRQKFSEPTSYTLCYDPLTHIKAGDDYVMIEPYDNYSVKALIHDKRGLSRCELWGIVDGITYPKTERLFDNFEPKEPCTFNVNADQISTVTKAIKTATGDKHVTIKANNRKPVYLQSMDNADIEGLVMPIIRR